MWSPEQLTAITAYGKNILVAAAAGSGKTAVLVERVVERIKRENPHHCDINQILIVTFTNAAAAEMRGRIAAAITEKLPDADKERQLVLLNAASISTLHAFCQNLIRQNFHELGLDPKFRLGSEQEISLLKLDVLEELFEAKYDEADNADFLHLTDIYGSERGDEPLYDIILKLYEYSRSQPFPAQWLSALPHYYELEGNSLDEFPWMALIERDVKNKLSSCRRIGAELHQQAQELKIEPLVKIAAADLEIIDSCLACHDWSRLQKTIGEASFMRMTSSKKIPAEIKEAFKARRDGVKDVFKQLQENYFEQPLEEVLNDIPMLRDEAAILCRTVQDFAAAFAKAKAEKSLLDFSDLEHFALQLLAAPGSTADELIPTTAALTLQEKYKEIMVDEYQDTNGVQEAILQLIASRSTPDCFFVGDVKQSIYKFRLADPGLFMQKYKSYFQGSADCQRIDLAKNFRSRRNILDAVNCIFSQVMTETAAELNYGEAEMLRCGLEYPPCSEDQTLDSPIELTIIDKNGTAGKEDTDSDENSVEQGFKAEAALIVNRIQALLSDGKVVYDKKLNDYRPLQCRDIVILTRTIKQKGQILSEALRSADIPVYSSDESGYFQVTEIRVMLSLLRIIDNPQQDIPLTAVLYSPIIGLNAAELTRVRLLAPEENMYMALMAAVDEESRLPKALKQKLSSFVHKLEKWRDYARRHSVPELIWLLLDETGYYDYVGGMKEGLVRQANLRALYDRAAAYEQTSFRGLFRFLRFVQRMQDMGSDLEVARSLGEGENVVRIMSIHKSKGLEFPVVILADAGKRFNLRDAQQEAVLIHKDLGLGLYTYDLENHIRYQTLPRQAIAQQITHELKAEEMRMLYTAMTRAREKLIIVGSVADAGKFAARCASHLPDDSSRSLPDECIESANNYLDWLGTALMRHPDGSALRRQSGRESFALLGDKSHWQIEFTTASTAAAQPSKSHDTEQVMQSVKKLEPLPETEYKDWAADRLNWQYPHAEALEIPAKLSVSEIKRRFALEEADGTAAPYIETAIFKRPRFLQQTTAMTPAEYGTLMHTVMQHLDLQGDLTDRGIAEQLRQMEKAEIIDREQLKKIYRQNIRTFLYSPLGTRLRKSQQVERELAFSRMMSVQEINAVFPGKKLYPESGGETVFIQGIIDLLFAEDDGLVLLDYKTDNCSAEEAREKYAVQIELYAAAAQAILQKPVKEKYLYLFHSGTVVNMQLP